MKKIIELEERWKSYKYKKFAFYTFIVVLAVFVVFLSLFIKLQYDKYTKIPPAQTQTRNAPSSDNPATSNATDLAKVSAESVRNTTDSNATSAHATFPSINFICRKVTTNRLTVRKEASFKSKPLGYYPKDGIFCAADNIVNGLLQTNNGWVSANDNYSQIVEVNMFVDSGFYKYNSTPSPNNIATQSVPQEIRALTPTIYPSTENLQNALTPQAPQTPQVAQRESEPPKPQIHISSEKITKEREIELKKADFNRNNSYDTAIEIAVYYFDIKDYKNALKWAVSASSADSKDKSKAQSWIIYAKSLYASGNKEKAIEVLNRYIANTNSKDAIDALNELQQGTI